MKNNKLYTSSTLFFTTCRNSTVNFLLFRAEEVNTGTNESEFGCGPQDSVGKFTYICQFKRVDGNKRKKVFLEKRTHILIARDVFLALAFIVAKAPYSHESDSSISVLLQLIWSNAEKYRYPNKLEKLFTLQNNCKFTRLLIHFRFLLQNL